MTTLYIIFISWIQIIAKLYVLYWWNVAITLQIHNFIMILYFKSKYNLSIRLRSSTVCWTFYENTIHNVYFLNEIIAKLYVINWWNVAITLQIHNFIMVLYFKSTYKLNIRLRSSTVERLTPDQKVACSNHVEVNDNFFIILKFISYEQKLVPFLIIMILIRA